MPEVLNPPPAQSATPTVEHAACVPRSCSHAARVVVAEDDWEMRRILASALARDGYEVTEVADGNQFLRQMTRQMMSDQRVAFDAVVSDIRMPGCSGLELLAYLRLWQQDTPVILITAFGDRATHARAKALGAVTLFDKPFDIDDLRDVVRSIVYPDSGAATQRD